MRLAKLTILLAAAMILFVAEHPLAASHTGIINVKDYGAKGDGVTDDTTAIRSAVTAAGTTRGETDPTGTYVQTGPALLFPEGKYMISDQINLNNTSGVLEVRGEGRPIIHQTNPNKHVFYTYYAYMRSIKNITFSGGKNHLNFSNPNAGTGDIVIEHCRFYGASGVAVWTDVTQNWIRITDCEFINCRQVWCNMLSVQSAMRDCTIYAGSQMVNKAAIEHQSGMLTIEDVVFIPSSASAGQRWIDNYAEWLTIRRCRFGEGSAGGITPVYNYRKYSGSVNPNTKGSTLIIEDCIESANSVEPTRDCLVYCAEVPNMLNIERSAIRGSSAVIVDSALDLDNYFYVQSPRILSFTMKNCIGSPTAAFPTRLADPVVHPL